MNTNFGDIVVRANQLSSIGSNLDQAAKKMSAEFHASIYVNKNKMWASFKDEKGMQQTRVVI